MLKEYQRKRHLTRSAEPAPVIEAKEAGPLIFVVHKHAARRLHYDLRLELDGVLKSWAVPSGPSLNPEEKKLAVMVEDHPFEYHRFEGTIPEGEYGAGQVIVWDSGTYSPESEGQAYFSDVDKAQEIARDRLAKGKLSFVLRGSKLKGSWTLVRMAKNPENWLLIKHKDSFASDRDILEEGRSVNSSLTIEDLKAGAKPADPADLKLGEIRGAKKAPMSASLSPMLASLAEAPFSHPDWYFEPKLDGYRILSFIKDGEVKLKSRRGLDITAEYPQVIASLREQPASQLILDGEMVALEPGGRPCFQCLQQHLELLRLGKKGEEKVHIVYYVFDILYLDGYDLRGVPLQQRKEILSRVLKTSDRVRSVEYAPNDGQVMFDASLRLGLEGVMAKLKDSLYETGKRSKEWLKVKRVQSSDFVIGGYLAGSGSRASTFGSMMLGYYDDGKLTYAGNVGTGYDEAKLNKLKGILDRIAADRSPFVQVPRMPTPVTWVKPELVAEVKFAEWTHEGYLRAPVFLRLREDKAPADVHHEDVAQATLKVEEVKGRKKVAQVKAKVKESDPVPAVEDAPRAGGKVDKAVLEQLQQPEDSMQIEVEGNRISLTHLNKVFWPPLLERRGLTKRDLITYFVTVAPYVLPHLKDRPLTLTRFPHGIRGEHFYQKHWADNLPGFVQHVTLSEYGSEQGEYMICDNLATLVWLGQIADIELHTWFSRINPEPDAPDLSDIKDPLKKINRLVDFPDFLIFDIDPYIYSGKESKGEEPELNRRAFVKSGEIAIQIKHMLDSLSLSAFIKTSGKTGLHIFVPILRHFEYETVRAAAGAISQHLLQKLPDDITVEWTVGKRAGKVFMDYRQNVRGKTLATVYSPRVSPEASVSTPLAWDEVGKVYPTEFTILTLPERLNRLGDLWANILISKNDLNKILKK